MTGKYQHTVDPKGRLFVPSKLRDALGEAFYVTLGLDHCLSAYTRGLGRHSREISEPAAVSAEPDALLLCKCG